MKIESVPLEKLRPLEKNPRRHPEKQIKELVRSFEQFGQYRPLVVDEEGTILAGNGMFQALGMAGVEKAKVYRVTGLSEDEKTKLILADNRTGDLSNDDFDVVEELLKTLSDYQVPGYDEQTLHSLLADAEQILDDADQYGILDPATIANLQGREDRVDEGNSGATEGTPPGPLAPTPTPGTDGWDGDASDEFHPPTAGGDASTEWEKDDVCPTCGRGW